MPLFDLITPENLPEIMTAIGGLLGGGGLLTWMKVRREPPKPGTPDAFAVAMVELTKAVQDMVAAMRGQNDHFADNNDMFRAMGPPVASMGRDIEAMRRHTETLDRILDALNRRG